MAPCCRLIGYGHSAESSIVNSRVMLLTACGLQVFKVLGREGINVKMMSQGASKNNISLIVSDDEGKNAVRSLHQEFFD